MMTLCALLFFLGAAPVGAQVRAVMEGVPASKWTIKVDTVNTRVEIATTSYGRGGNAIPNTALFTTSNVVIGAGNAIVLYATGTVVTSTVSAQYMAGSTVSSSLVSASTVSTQYLSVGTATVNTLLVATVTATGGSFTQSILVNGVIVPSTVTASINHSTATVDDIAASGITQANFSVCHATVTYTTSSSCRAIQVFFSGNMSRTGAGTFGCKLNFKEDSAFVKGDIDKGVIHGTSASATVIMSGTFSYLIRCPAAGAHSYCLSMATYATPTACAFEAGITSSGNQFGVMEIH